MEYSAPGRSEKQKVCLAAGGGEELDLEKLFSMSATEKDVCEVFVYCLAVHLGRWNNLMAHSTGCDLRRCQNPIDESVVF